MCFPDRRQGEVYELKTPDRDRTDRSAAETHTPPEGEREHGTAAR